MKIKKTVVILVILTFEIFLLSASSIVNELESLYKNKDYKTLLKKINTINRGELSYEDALEIQFYLAIAYINTGKEREGLKLLEEYFNKKENIKRPDPLIELYKLYDKAGIKRKSDFYRKILFNHFPYDKRVIKLKIEYCRKILLYRNWSEALMYLIDLDDKGYSKKHPEILLLIAEAYYYKDTYTISAEYYRKYIKATGRKIFESPSDVYYAGESFYNTLNYDSSLKMFLYLINVYPKSRYYGDSLLRVGDIFFNQKKYFLSAVFYREYELKFFKKDKYYLSRIKLADAVKYMNKRELLKLRIPYDYKNPVKIYLEVIKNSDDLELVHLALRKLLNFSDQKGKLETALWYLHDYLKKKIVDPKGEELYRSYFERFLKKYPPPKVADYFMTVKKSFAFLKTKELLLLANSFKKGKFFELEKETLELLYKTAIDNKLKSKVIEHLIENAYSRKDWKTFEEKLKEYDLRKGKKPYPKNLIPLIIEYYFYKESWKKYDSYYKSYKNLLKSKHPIKYELYEAIALYHLSKLNESEAIADNLITLKNKGEWRAEIFKSYAFIKLKLKKYDSALKILKLMVSMGDYPDWAIFQIGKIYYMKGEKEKAKKEFDKLKKLYPSSFWTSQIDVIISSYEDKGKGA